MGWEHDDVRLPSGDFTNTLVTSRFRYSFNTTTFNTTTFLNALIQYNSTLKEVSSNIRFNWIYKPLSDFSWSTMKGVPPRERWWKGY